MGKKRHINRLKTDKERSCDGKIKYAKESLARHDAIWLERRTGDEISHYKCRYCAFWHVGHTPRELRVRKKVGKFRTRKRNKQLLRKSRRQRRKDFKAFSGSSPTDDRQALCSIGEDYQED